MWYHHYYNRPPNTWTMLYMNVDKAFFNFLSLSNVFLVISVKIWICERVCFHLRYALGCKPYKSPCSIMHRDIRLGHTYPWPDFLWPDLSSNFCLCLAGLRFFLAWIANTMEKKQHNIQIHRIFTKYYSHFNHINNIYLSLLANSWCMKSMHANDRGASSKYSNQCSMQAPIVYSGKPLPTKRAVR